MHEISDRRDQGIAAITYGSDAVVGALHCLRGISTLAAFGLAVVIGDWNRFTGSTIGAYLGRVPTEHSSGRSRSLGSITKTGNSHGRRLLVEAAGHHRRPNNNPSRLMRSRWEEAPQRRECGVMPGTGDCTNAGSATSSAASARPSPMSPSPASSPDGADPWPPAHIRPGGFRHPLSATHPGTADPQTPPGNITWTAVPCSAWSKPAIYLWAT